MKEQTGILIREETVSSVDCGKKMQNFRIDDFSVVCFAMPLSLSLSPSGWNE